MASPKIKAVTEGATGLLNRIGVGAGAFDAWLRGVTPQARAGAVASADRIVSEVAEMAGGLQGRVAAEMPTEGWKGLWEDVGGRFRQRKDRAVSSARDIAGRLGAEVDSLAGGVEDWARSSDPLRSVDAVAAEGIDAAVGVAAPIPGEFWRQFKGRSRAHGVLGHGLEQGAKASVGSAVGLMRSAWRDPGLAALGLGAAGVYTAAAPFFGSAQAAIDPQAYTEMIGRSYSPEAQMLQQTQMMAVHPSPGTGPSPSLQDRFANSTVGLVQGLHAQRLS